MHAASVAMRRVNPENCFRNKLINNFHYMLISPVGSRLSDFANIAHPSDDAASIFSSHFTRLGGIFEIVIYHPALHLYDGT